MDDDATKRRYAQDVNGHRFLPTGGHRNSPVADVFSPHWWPSILPTSLGIDHDGAEAGGRSGVLGMAFEIGGGSPVLGP